MDGRRLALWWYELLLDLILGRACGTERVVRWLLDLQVDGSFLVYDLLGAGAWA